MSDETKIALNNLGISTEGKTEFEILCEIAEKWEELANKE